MGRIGTAARSDTVIKIVFCPSPLHSTFLRCYLTHPTPNPSLLPILCNSCQTCFISRRSSDANEVDRGLGAAIHQLQDNFILFTGARLIHLSVLPPDRSNFDIWLPLQLRASDKRSTASPPLAEEGAEFAGLSLTSNKAWPGLPSARTNR